ncbi:hypothetical protein HN873_051653, partial [Arachis hypogaea]
KVYKSYHTRRNLADCAVVVEELWWKALDFAALKRSSVSFFDVEKQESAVSRWARARTRAAKADFSEFIWFYDFVFFMCRENGQKNISVSRAVTAWKLVLAGNEQGNEY